MEKFFLFFISKEERYPKAYLIFRNIILIYLKIK